MELIFFLSGVNTIMSFILLSSIRDQQITMKDEHLAEESTVNGLRPYTLKVTQIGIAAGAKKKRT